MQDRMKEFDSKVLERFFWGSLIYLEIVGAIAIFILFFWDNLSYQFGLSNAFKDEIGASYFYRNRGFALTATIGLALTGAGMALTIWGRIQTQHQTRQTQEQIELSRKSNTDERFESASRMLGNNVLAVRVASCYVLRNLGSLDESDKEIARRCLNLLSAYISNPYIGKDDEKKLEDGFVTPEMRKHPKLEDYFSSSEPLRTDIQAAIDSLNTIYKYHHERDQNFQLGNITFPHYFWLNSYKGEVFLPNIKSPYANLSNTYLRKSNLQGAMLRSVRLQNANFEFVNLNEANLIEANLQNATFIGTDFINSDLSLAQLKNATFFEANFSGAKMIKTDLSDAQMETVDNLTTDQILDAIWGHYKVDDRLEQGPPQLPHSFMQDKEVRNWLSKPHYKRNKKQE